MLNQLFNVVTDSTVHAQILPVRVIDVPVHNLGAGKKRRARHARHIHNQVRAVGVGFLQALRVLIRCHFHAAFQQYLACRLNNAAQWRNPGARRFDHVRGMMAGQCLRNLAAASIADTNEQGIQLKGKRGWTEAARGQFSEGEQ